ncbi:DUF5677 domain-containing protein [Actinomadura sp. NPDC048032]|uniref:DUF5677 domain-containing protein n=1 Tax=Actinomadura sp. NPDC048032 TaxID=3155747 RepID=UPI0034050D61
MYQFGDNQETIRRARAITPQLIAEANKIAGDETGVDIHAEHQQVFPILFGWWRFVTRTAEAIWHLDQAGFRVEAAPLVRNLIGHTYASIWLADNGVAALRALQDYTVRQTNTLLKDMREKNWPAAEEIPDEPTPVFDFKDSAEEKTHNSLRGEIETFPNLVKAYGTPEMYPVYRHLSRYCHTTLTTATSYLHQGDDGNLSLLDVPADSASRPDIIQTPICLIQTGKVISPMIAGDPLRKVLDTAARDLGLPPNYQPKRY